MSVQVTNTTSSLSGKTLLKAEDAQTIDGLKTYDRGGSAPFACVSGAAKVSYLDADKLDGQEGAYYTDAGNLDAGTVPTARLGSGTASSSTFLRGDQSWAAVNVKPFLIFTPAHNTPPASAYATLDTRNARLVLDFDGSTDEEAVFTGVLPASYAGGGLTIDVFVALTTATSGSVRFQAAIERIEASALDIDSDSFAAFQSAGGTAPGTNGQVIVVSIALTDGAQMDSLAAGEAFRLKIRRDADGTSGTDDITTDAEVLRVVLKET